MKNNLYTLITGASEGLGKAMAIECASRQMNLILVSLPDTHLQQLADQLNHQYGIDVVTIETDLSIEENCIAVFEKVKQLKLSVNILINNVGLGSTMLFKEGTIAFYQKQLNINVVATTLLTHLFLDVLKTNAPSYILSVGSLSSFFYLMKKQVYGATKSYIYFFSKSLRRELIVDNINVSVVCPGPINTNPTVINLNKSSNWLTRLSTMNPEEVAPIAIDGLLNNKEVIIPGKLNQLFLVLDKLLPPFIKEWLTNYQMKKMVSVSN